MDHLDGRRKEKGREGGRQDEKEKTDLLYYHGVLKDMSQKNVSLNWDPGDEG